ncbi:hypothetical protein BGW36DRAFT_402566 [Talaromyces proteolyticus]|uniref:FAD-binding PCMH-type domain-containing protein n=1 Tax=Talaromyces proteolyticus TaxID=1131652 RepID=A0AAD4L6J8_9EURO|nr:uncharacterized protein BGW36DRAFT_402566 [Talaromyces proteolyticus]KAH8704869.1 hypothetical protein BGW36DRAFT_402566 [Talaromyces proteolyticus]
MKLKNIFSLALISTCTQACETLLPCLKAGLSSAATISFKDQSTFLNESIRYAALYPPSFSAVVKVASAEDIAVAIKCAARTNTSFLATSARHGFSTTLTSIQNGLEIDTSYLNKIQVDADANELIVEGAVIFQDAVDDLYTAGKEISTGSCFCVGFVGATLGGGVGRLSGVHGLMIDSLLSVRIMLPNTTIVEASTDQNPELFWGLRGAGFNFGVILNATYRIYDQTPQGLHLNADFKFPISQAASYYGNLSEVAKAQPAPLAIITYFNFDPGLNETVITANAVYAGPESEGLAAVQFLVDQNPIQKNLTMVPWNQLLTASAFGATGPPLCIKGDRRAQWGVGVERLDVETYSQVAEKFVEMITKYPASKGSVVDMQLLPTQAVVAQPDDSTAYPWRNLISHINIQTLYTDNTTDDETTGYPRLMRDMLAKTAGTDDLQVYVSYSHGDESLESLFGAHKLPRLAALKKEIDPHGLFNAYHPLPTQYP